MYTIYLGLITDCLHSAADRRSILPLPAPSRLGKHWREDRGMSNLGDGKACCQKLSSGQELTTVHMNL